MTKLEELLGSPKELKKLKQKLSKNESAECILKRSKVEGSSCNGDCENCVISVLRCLASDTKEEKSCI